MDRKIRYFVNGWSFRLSFATRPGYDGDHEDISDGDSYELGEYENSEEALAAGRAFENARDGRRAEKVLVDGAKKKVGEMDRLEHKADRYTTVYGYMD